MSTGVPRKIVWATLQALVRRGLAECVSDGRYRITEAGREVLAAGKAPRSGPQRRVVTRAIGLRARLWTTARMARKFTLGDLLMVAERGGERRAADNARHYLRALEQAGYLARMARREPGAAPTSNGYVRWLLVRDTGPRAPVWRKRAGTLFDPNTGQEHPCRIG